MTAAQEFARLVEIMHKLREHCPWDRRQTHQSLRTYLLEESYELLQALDDGAPEQIREELGDLMLQIVFHAEIGAEGGSFGIEQVLSTINEKLVRRHPHVFDQADARDAGAVNRNWESIKRTEKKGRSALSGVPEHLPALLKAARVLSKIRHSGVDPFDARDAVLDARLWLERLEAAVESHDEAQAERAIGMLGLAAAEVAMRVRINPEDALRRTLRRLADAFQREEARLDREGRVLHDLDCDERERLAARLLVQCEEG